MKVTDEMLQKWLDGEAGESAEAIEAYVESHPDAVARVEALSRNGQFLRELIDGALGPVEPLNGVAAIRTRIHEERERRWQRRLASWWNDVWMFHRTAVVGVAFAAVAGVVAAPVVIWLAGYEAQDYANAPMAEVDSGEVDLYKPAAISIESLEVGGNGSARVLDAGGTTLIWVEGDASDEMVDDEEFDGSERR